MFSPLLVAALATSWERWLPVGRCQDPRDTGARAGGGPKDFTINTAAIQQVLDASHNDNRCVLITGGDFYVSELFLKSNTTLHLEQGARLIATIYPSLNATKKAVLHIEDVHNVTVIGRGHVHGSAEDDIAYFSATDDRFQPIQPDGVRPYLVHVTNSSNVFFGGVSLRNSTDWTLRERFPTEHHVPREPVH